MIRLCEIPSTGLNETTKEPNYTIDANAVIIHLIKFHPIASNVLASVSYDMTFQIWDLESLKSGKSMKS